MPWMGRILGTTFSNESEVSGAEVSGAEVSASSPIESYKEMPV
jgi:hypothetical protein